MTFDTAKLKASLPHVHPLASLTKEEQEVISNCVKDYNKGKKLMFRRIYKKEPHKKTVIAYLQAELEGSPLPTPPPRIGQALFYFAGEEAFMECLVDIGEARVIGQRHLEGHHGAGDDDEMHRVSKAALESDMVKKELERLQIPEDCVVVAEPWPYGTDDEMQTARLFEVWMFLQSKETKHHPSSNFYAHPLDFACVIDGRDFSAVRIDRMPTTSDFAASTDPNARYKHHPDAEYAPDLLPNGVRKDLRPLQIIQPEGVSFTIQGEVFKWQKWEFVLNFDLREGMVLRNVRYEGRPIFYRISTSEMTVPYGDPRSPVHRKSAYDFGECGAGQTSNDLQLGCDCLGVIHYVSGLGCDSDGNAVHMPNRICVHEQDAGIGSKHTNVRTGKAEVNRIRELVLQLILTVGNYEYALYWIFDTMGNLHWEVRATGIMSVTPIEEGVDPEKLKYGTIVAPGVFAPHHQHLFALRIEPAIDGYDSSILAYDETKPMPRDEKNPYGVGFEATTTKVDKETAFDLDASVNRVIKFLNPKKLNPVTGKPVGYKLTAPPTQLGLAVPGSMHDIRGEFVNNHVHYTKHDEEEMYAAGEHNWQSRGGGGGCKSWSSRGRPIEDGDGVVWFTLGFTHITRAEDWPLMPCEVFRMHFKPVNFFTVSPQLDVPPSLQSVNKSVLADVSGGSCCKPQTNGTNGVAQSNGHASAATQINGH